LGNPDRIQMWRGSRRHSNVWLHPRECEWVPAFSIGSLITPVSPRGILGNADFCKAFMSAFCILQAGEGRSAHGKHPMAPKFVSGYYVGISHFPMNSLPTTLDWRAFDKITSGPEAASAAACCAFSLGTLEVASLPDAQNFVMTERKQPEVWRWAVIGEGGTILEEGCEATQEDAKRSAAEAYKFVSVESPSTL
jgi:hypothetical protein